MQNLRIRHKLFILCAGLLFVSTALSIAVVNYFATEQANDTIQENLNRSYHAFRQTEDYRYHMIDIIATSLASDAGLHTVIIKTNYDTWLDTLNELLSHFEETPESPQLLFLLTDKDGKTRVRTDKKEQPHNEDLSNVAAVKSALDGNPANGYWMTGNTLYQITAVTWSKGEYPDGAFLVGWKVDEKLATTLQDISHTDVTFISNDHIRGASPGAQLSDTILPVAQEEEKTLSLKHLESHKDLMGLYHTRLISKGSQRFLVLVSPLLDSDGKTMGSLVLEVSLDKQLEFLRNTQSTLALLAAAVILMGILVSTLISRRVTGPLLNLAGAARQLAKGNYDVTVPVRSSDEIGELASTFDQMRHAIVEQLEQLKSSERVRRDLELAHNIQTSLLPSEAPVVLGLEVAGLCRTANRVGGDYYDYLEFSDSQASLDIVIADVFGHDVGAALMMATGRTALRSAADKTKSPSQILQQANHTLYSDLVKAELLISLAYLRVDREGMKLHYANAGHNLPFVYRPLVVPDGPDGAEPRHLSASANAAGGRASAAVLTQPTPSTSAQGEIVLLSTRGMVLGLLDAAEYPLESVDLRHGDILVLYTDGVTEAENSQEVAYGTDSLYKVIDKNHELSAQQMMDAILTDVENFTGRKLFDDDVTLVIVKVHYSKELQARSDARAASEPGTADGETEATDPAAKPRVKATRRHLKE